MIRREDWFSIDKYYPEKDALVLYALNNGPYHIAIGAVHEETKKELPNATHWTVLAHAPPAPPPIVMKVTHPKHKKEDKDPSRDKQSFTISQMKQFMKDSNPTKKKNSGKAK